MAYFDLSVVFVSHQSHWKQAWAQLLLLEVPCSTSRKNCYYSVSGLSPVTDSAYYIMVVLVLRRKGLSESVAPPDILRALSFRALTSVCVVGLTQYLLSSSYD